MNLEGVTVTRVQTKKKDPKVGSWDWYHIKSWDVAPKHFAFKIVGSSKDASAKNYMFDTAEAKAIASKFKEQVNAIMARKRKQKEAAESGQSCEPQRAPPPPRRPSPPLAPRGRAVRCRAPAHPSPVPDGSAGRRPGLGCVRTALRPLFLPLPR